MTLEAPRASDPLTTAVVSAGPPRTVARRGDRLRVAIVAPPWLPVPPPAYGGTELVIDLLATGLARAGHDVVLYATGDSTCAVPRRSGLGQGGWSPGVSEGVLTELQHVTWAYSDMDGFDIVHDHTLVGPFVAAHFGVRPVVTTNHGPFLDPALGQVYRALHPSVGVIAISGNHASHHTVPVSAVIHHGIDVESYELGRGDGGYVLFLGRMHPDKGVHLAVRAARKAGVPILLAAKLREPAEMAYFDEAIAPHLGPTVTYVGEADATTKRRLLAGAMALVNPIQWEEPFGLVMVEALASGTPVVATRHGAAPEIVEDGVTGFLCDDVDSLAGAIGRVASIDRRTCRRHAEVRFSVGRMVDDHVRLYRRIVAGAASSRSPVLVGAQAAGTLDPAMRPGV